MQLSWRTCVTPVYVEDEQRRPTDSINMALLFGLIGTIADDDDVVIESEESSDDEEAVRPKKLVNKKNAKKTGGEDFAQDFDFAQSLSDDDDPWSADLVSAASSQRVVTSLEHKIAKIRRERKKKETKEKEKEVLEGDAENKDDDEENGPGVDEEEEEDDVQGFDDFSKWDKVKVKSTSEKRLKRINKEIESDDEEEENKPFFQEAPDEGEAVSFTDMNLSRPLLRAVSGLNFVSPTPIQSKTIPIALLGKDICACAATGTGKTAAFMLPVLERLLYKPKQAPVTRVLVLTPTRELGVQIFTVTRQLAEFTNIEACLAVGGLDIKLQEAALRKGPDIVIATPGRLIDHLHNAPTFSLGSVEVLILDEADRMLDEYFEEQMKEIIRMCSVTRQTMLFSATMTDKVKDLAMVSLKNPVRVFVNENTDVAFNLQQEFIRIRPNREGDREAIVSALCCRNFHNHCMVFVQTKKQAHRLHIILGLLGIKVGELHGNLSQTKRMEMLRLFKDQQVDVMVATDLAARGLDIEGVRTVINFTMPNSAKHYIHRVGRTARAGRSGRSVSLAGEKERRMLKELVKKARNPVKSRVVPQDVVAKYRDKIASLEPDIEEVIQMESEEKEMQATELQLHKAAAMLNHRQEIMSRPKRSWFQTHKERMQQQAALRLEGPAAQPSKEQKKKDKKKKPQTAEDRVNYELLKIQQFAARSAKRDRKQKRIRAFNDVASERREEPPSKKQKKNKGQQRSTSSFEKELTSTSKSSVKQFRSKANEAKKMKEISKHKGSKGSKGKGKGKPKGKRSR